jgi:S1-C subfamily serine protease
MIKKIIATLVLILFFSSNVFAGMSISNSERTYHNFEQFLINKALQYVNIMIVNKTIGCLGSGATIKYNEKYYILTAYHLLDEETDELFLYENGESICQLKVVKTEPIHDLLLLAPIDDNVVPQFYCEIGNREPMTAEDVMVVGNPDGNEDVVEDARVMKYEYEHMIIRGGLFFGNSGGGVYDYQGYLVGIVSSLKNVEYMDVSYTVFNIIRLHTIVGFMSELMLEKDKQNWE